MANSEIKKVQRKHDGKNTQHNTLQSALRVANFSQMLVHKYLYALYGISIRYDRQTDLQTGRQGDKGSDLYSPFSELFMHMGHWSLRNMQE